jgi:adenosine deaminase
MASVLASDLHVHLDGSLRASTLVELARERGVCPADAADGEYAEALRFRPGMSLGACLERFAVTTALLDAVRPLERVATELVEDAYLDGVRHTEVRLCPYLHTRGGLAPEAVVEAVVAGLERGAALCAAGSAGVFGSSGVVVTILEGMGEAEATALADLALRYSDLGVVGLDLAGDEALFDAAPYRGAFARARDAGLGITVHAGEGHPASNVRDAVRVLGARRIGHGTSAAQDRRVLDLLAGERVTIECCITSNVHTGAIASVEEHPLRAFLAAGVPAVLATDNTFFSRTSLSREYDIASERLALERRDLERMAIESARSAFASEEDRGKLARLYAASVEAGRGAGEEETLAAGEDEAGEAEDGG